jgi:hypothetical protein
MSEASVAAARITEILTCAEAKGQEQLALHLATTTHISVDQAKARLRGEDFSGAIAAINARTPSRAVSATSEAERQPAPPATAAVVSQASISALWDQALRSRGMTLQGDAPAPGMTPATPNPPPLAAPDWDAVLRSRGMQVG